MIRYFSWLLIMGYCALLALTLHRPPQTAATVSVPPAPPPPLPLTVYYEKDSLPPELFKEWAAPQRLVVNQRPLLPDADGHWPADGDLYVVSPRRLASLRQQIPLRAPADGELARAVNPAFTSQPFDADNQFTVPWRWTPYVAYLRHKNFAGILTSKWTDDADLLIALYRQRHGFSANSGAADRETLAAVQREFGAVASEAECWQEFLADKIGRTILPASYMEKNFANPQLADATLTMPNGELRGTIIHLDLLAVAADRDADRQRLADDLSRHLLTSEQQQRLVTVSGYFPVVTKLGHEFDFAPVPLPRERWFNRSEFLLDHTPTVSAAPAGP